MEKVFEIKHTEDSLGRYNAKKTSTICIVCDSFDEAINHVLSPHTRSVELISVKPCLILK